MVIRKELERAIADSPSRSAQWLGAHRLRLHLDIVEADGFVDRHLMYSINGGRIIYDPENLTFELKDDDGKNVGGGNLTHIEQKLLNLLVRNQGRVVNYLTIENELWGPDSFMNAQFNTKRHVSSLRRKLEPGIEDAWHNSIFRNVKDIGYKMEAFVEVVDKTPKKGGLG